MACSVTVKVQGVKFRKEPGLNSVVLGLIYKDETLWLGSEPNVRADNIDWIQVWRPRTNQVGWVASDLVEIGC